MGDIIHALPVAHDIRQALPEAELHWVAEESFRDIPTLAPAVSKVHVTAFRRWRKAILSGPVRAEMADVKNALRAEHYDVAYLVTSHFYHSFCQLSMSFKVVISLLRQPCH